MPSSPLLPHSGGLSGNVLASVQRSPGLWAAVIILISFSTRLWFIMSGQLDLVQDEAQYWDWSRRFQLSYYSKGPLIAWLIDFWVTLLGNTEAGVRMGAVVNATLAQILLYWGAAKLFRRPSFGVMCLIVANTMPLFLASGVLMTTDNILMLCWLGALLSLYALTNSPNKITLPLLALGLCMGVGNLAKYMMLAMFAVAVLYFILLHRQNLLRRGLALKALLVMAFGAFLGYLPILIWNAQNGWIGILHVGSLAGVTGAGASRIIRLDTVPEFLGGQLGVASPWWMVLMLFAGWRAALYAWKKPAILGNNTAVNTAGQTQEANLDTDKFSTCSTDALSHAERIRQAALMACAFWPLWGGMFVWSFHTRIYANWPGMSYVGGIMLAAAGLERLLSGRTAGGYAGRAYRWAMVWPITGALLFALIFAQNFLPLPAHLNPATRLKGWADLGQELGRLASTLPNASKVFYFGDNYDVTAELAFYAPGQPIAYSADFGRRRSQYDLWPDPTGHVLGKDQPVADSLVGWDALYVSTRGRTPEELFTMFDEVTTIPYPSIHRGKPGRDFTIVLLRNFNGHWPHTEYARY